MLVPLCPPENIRQVYYIVSGRTSMDRRLQSDGTSHLYSGMKSPDLWFFHLWFICPKTPIHQRFAACSRNLFLSRGADNNQYDLYSTFPADCRESSAYRFCYVQFDSNTVIKIAPSKFVFPSYNHRNLQQIYLLLSLDNTYDLLYLFYFLKYNFEMFQSLSYDFPPSI